MATATSKPATSQRESSSRESTHSGRLLLRMPRALHAQLAARSDASGLSLNQYIVETLTRALEGEGAERGRDPTPPRSLRFALLANAVVVALAAATCVVLLAVAWH
jgi:HicB family